MKTRFIYLIFLMIFSFYANGFAQNTEASGTVTSGSDGTPLPGVNVVISGTTQGTITDIEGNYSIQVPGPETEIQFSYIGFITQTIKVGNQTTINVVLEEETKILDEIVVIGYGTIKKSDLTGAVSTVKTDELTQLATYDVQQAMQGRVAGVMVTSNTGAPGDGAKVRIRGISTINNSDPLYVVDGFPTGDINFINPSDIESMEVLKDASATAIYGNRGANGVVLITTKKGTKKETQVDLQVYTGFTKVNRTIPVLDAQGYAEAKYMAYDNQAEIRENPDLALRGSGEPLDSLFSAVLADGRKGTNWQDEVMRQGTVKSYSVNVSGGDEKYTYNLSGNYYNEEGIIINSWLKRYLLRYSSQMEITKHIKGEFNISYRNQERTNYDQSLYGEGILPAALYADPISPVYIPGTDPKDKQYAGVNVSQTTNPVASADRMEHNRTKTDQLVTNLGLDIELIKGLIITSKFGADVTYDRPKRYIPAYDIGDKDLNPQSSLDETHQRTYSWNNSNYINYTTQINKHNINLMAGQEWQYFDDFRTRIRTFDIPDNPDLYYATASPFTTAPIVNQEAGSNNRYEWQATLFSYFGRINYSYDGKYLLTVNFRRDASSKIAKNYRWGNFPSLSIGWNIKNENFLKDVSLLSTLKLRLGCGKTGNEGGVTDVYLLYAQVTPGLWMAGPGGERLEGAIQTVNPNEKLQWEEVEQLNYGVDFGFLNNKLIGTIDYFTKSTSGMIIEVPPPVFTGTNASAANIGTMENKGVEISLNYKNFDGELKYEISGNITFLDHPQVTALADSGQKIPGGQAAKLREINRTIAGEEMAHFYGFKTDGLLSQDDIDNTYVIDGTDTTFTYSRFYPGQIKLVDLDGDGEITPEDKTNIGSANPDFIYGFNINLMYKNIDVKLFCQGVYGNELINTLNVWLKVPDEGNQNLHEEVLNTWTPENQNTTVPRLVQGNKIFQTYFNDYLVEDASYFRLKNVQLGYTIPNNLSQKVGISNCRFYISVENLLTITKYTGLDPEVGNFQYNSSLQRRDPKSQGLDDAIYPIAKRFLFGLNINF